MYAPRTMLFSGSWTTNAEPPPPISVRNIHDFGFVAPNRSRSMRAYRRRPARNFATSSKIFPHAVKLNEIRGAKSSTEIPRASIQSEEHTSELQSRFDLVCRLLLEKKKYIIYSHH